MATISTTKSVNMSPELVTEIFTKTKGHSAIANLCAQTPIPFSGIDVMTFAMDGEVSIVGEGGQKPAGEATHGQVTIKPLKVIYQHRVSDEFLKVTNEKQLPYLQAFADGFSAKIARAIDIMAFHGVNPATKEVSDNIGNNCFDKAISNKVTFDAAKPDDNIDNAITPIQEADRQVTGIAMAPKFANALGKMKTGAKENVNLYPEFRFGQTPTAFGQMPVDVNSTVSFDTSSDRAIIGDFQNAFKWGYSEQIPMEVIQYGDPDGQGDLKRTNQVVLRAEAYIGWGILDTESFAIVEAGA